MIAPIREKSVQSVDYHLVGKEIMTKEKSVFANTNRSWGDAAVDGLWPGIVGGLLMLVYLLISGLLNGIQPSDVFAYFVIDDALPVASGVLLHLATSAVYGAFFGLLSNGFGRYRPAWLPFWGLGLGYSLVLMLGAWLIVIPSGMSGLNTVPPIHLLIAHLLFGFGLGWLLGKGRSTPV